MAKGKHNSGKIDFLGNKDWASHGISKENKIAKQFFKYMPDSRFEVEMALIRSFDKGMKSLKRRYVIDLIEDIPALKKYSDITDIIPAEEGTWESDYYGYHYGYYRNVRTYDDMILIKRCRKVINAFDDGVLVYFALEASDVLKIIMEYKVLLR